MKYKVGVIAGNFDVIHPGYIYMFSEMSKLCEVVHILLHIDPSLERPEKLKPVLDVWDRLVVLKSLRQIDLITPYATENDLLDLLIEINPDVRFLGYDYKDKMFTGSGLPIPIHYINRKHGWSTTLFKKLIHSEYEKRIDREQKGLL